MAPLLKNLLGNGSKDRESADEMRALLQELRQERERFEALLVASRSAVTQLEELGEPIANARTDLNAVTSRLGEMQERLQAVAVIATQVQSLSERSEGLEQEQKRAQSEFATVLADAQQIRAVFEELREKVDVAVGLKDRLEAFLEVEKPFQVLRGEGDALRGQIEATGEHLGRIRQQHERLMDAHKLGVSKMEALDRRRDELGRDLQDKERRVIGVEQAVRGMDGVRQAVDDVKRELGSLKALADSLTQKTSSLDAQREAVDRALGQADSLDRAMRQIDAGIRQQHDNEKILTAMQEAVATLKTLHEQVLERSNEIAGLQRQTEEQASHIRHELNAAQDEVRNAVERFDFEGKGLEAVSQRVADLRGALADFENRYQGLRESSQTVGQLDVQTQALANQVRELGSEATGIETEVRKLAALRRELDEAGRTTHDLAARVTRIEQARPAVEATVRDVEQLRGAQAMVKDALEQVQVTHREIEQMRTSQAETRTWLTDAERSLGGLSEEVQALQAMEPALQQAQQQAERIQESLASIESRRDFVDDLHRRVTELGNLSAALDERSRDLQTRMDAAEQRFLTLEAQSKEAERIAQTIAGVTAGVEDAVQRAEAIGRSVTAFEKRCRSVESLAQSTEALRDELDQRQHALAEASKNLQKASKLRAEAATSAQQLEELAQQLDQSLASAGEQARSVGETSAQLEERVAALHTVDRRLSEFEARLAKWELVDEEVARSLEQISARQGTVQTLRADLERMCAMAERTSSDVRTITAASREVAEGREMLDSVMERLREIETTTSGLDERRRQMAQAEERLARAEGFLADVRSSLEALQGQKTLVDQAVEKAGSLRYLLKQAEAMVEGLRDERKMTASVRDAVAFVREDDEEEAEGKVA